MKQESCGRNAELDKENCDLNGKFSFGPARRSFYKSTRSLKFHLLVKHMANTDGGQCAHLLLHVGLECHVMLSSCFLITQNKRENSLTAIAEVWNCCNNNKHLRKTSIFADSHADR